VIRNIEIIGEASNSIAKHYPNFVARHPELELSSAYQMRNAVAHGYFKVDFKVVWKVIQRDLPNVLTDSKCSKLVAASTILKKKP
jgi:uncharacterized protein with HEPN domain